MSKNYQLIRLVTLPSQEFLMFNEESDNLALIFVGLFSVKMMLHEAILCNK